MKTPRTWAVRCVAGAAVLLAMAATVRPVVAQVSKHGYVFGAFGADSGLYAGTLHMGGGGDRMITDAFGVGVELGYLGYWEGMGEGFGVFSANGSYFFGPGTRARKVRPFVTGGYTAFFGSEGGASLVNFGVGMHYWMRDRLGLRLEFRDHTEGTFHYWGGRIGVTFR